MFNPSETSTSIGCSFLHIKQTRLLPYRGYIFFKTTFLLFIGIISIEVHYLSEVSNSIGSSFFHIIKQTWSLPYRGLIFFKAMFPLFLGTISTKIHSFSETSTSKGCTFFKQTGLLLYRGCIFFEIFGWLPWLPYKRHKD